MLYVFKKELNCMSGFLNILLSLTGSWKALTSVLLYNLYRYSLKYYYLLTILRACIKYSSWIFGLFVKMYHVSTWRNHRANFSINYHVINNLYTYEP